MHAGCHSSGNHAGALALAAKLRGIPAFIVVPRNAPACKMAAVKEYGGETTTVAGVLHSCVSPTSRRHCQALRLHAAFSSVVLDLL